MADGVAMSVEGVEEILRAFQILPRNIQKKYLGAAVREASENEVPELKSLTPKGPTGNLRRSVGFKLEKKKRITKKTNSITMIMTTMMIRTELKQTTLISTNT